MSSSQPKKIYRYQKFSANTIESLCNDQLYFSDPGVFNDPLECRPVLESDSDTITLRLILAKLISKRVEAEAIASLNKANIKGEKALAHAKKLAEKSARNELAYIGHYATNPEYAEYNISEEQAEIGLLNSNIEIELLKQYDRGICCFASAANNPLMWSHYGDQHHGLCIGYSLNRNPKPILHKVIYGGSRKILTSLVVKALLNNDSESQELLDRNVLLRKGSSWGYECEWRLFGSRGIQDSPLALEDVTFGLRCSDSVMHSVITSLKGREKVKFYKMYESRDNFKLKRQLLDFGEIQAYLPRTSYSGEELFGAVELPTTVA